MTLPPSWNTDRVFGTFRNFDDGSPCEGAVTFDPVRVVTAPEGEGRTVVMPRPRQVRLDAAGKLDIQLPATDDTDLDATGWVYKVAERIAPANRSYFIAAPLAGGDIDLATVVPLVPPPLLESTIGPPGKSAYQVWLEAGNTGTEADFLAALQGPPGDITPEAQAAAAAADAAALAAQLAAETARDESGLSAYDLAVQQGYVGTLTDWLASLKGTDGTDAVWTQITQAAYNALSPPDAGTLYVIKG